MAEVGAKKMNKAGIKNILDNPLISVIVPAYNAEQYIRDCLDSIINQTYQNLEIICINDGSQDNTAEILNEYDKADSRFIVIHRQNKGLVSARKEGVKIARGEYICYVDADDWIDPEMYMIMYNEGMELDVDIVAVGMCREFRNGTSYQEPNIIPQGIYRGEVIKNKILPKVMDTDKFYQMGLSFSLCHYAFKKEILLYNQLAVDDRIQMGEDTACCIFCLYQCNSITLIDRCLYHYRQSESSMKRTSKTDSLQCCQILYRSLVQRASIFQERKILLKKIDRILFFYLMLSSYSVLLEGKSFLFPYSKVSKGENIVIYGAGIFGEEMYDTVKKTGFCNITGWVDSNYEAYQSNIKPVSNPTDIIRMQFDHVVIAISNPDYRRNVIKNLQELKIASEKIADIDINILVHEMLPDRLI